MKKRNFHALLVKLWAYVGIALVLGTVVFLFGYIFWKGGSSISWEFLTQSPRGAVLGSEGGIWPAIVGSLYFTLVAIVIGAIPAIATALYLVFYCKGRKTARAIRLVIQCISGIPSIVLGLFAYSFLVRDLGLGRCVLSAGTALGIMILPFIEVRAEKAFGEVSSQMLRSAYALGCSKRYAIVKLVLPQCRGELVSGVILGGCYAMGATAPLFFTGAVAYAAVPDLVLKPAMALPMHLYLLVAQGETSMGSAYGTAFVMMALILICNLLASIYAGRSHKR